MQPTDYVEALREVFCLFPGHANSQRRARHQRHFRVLHIEMGTIREVQSKRLKGTPVQQLKYFGWAHARSSALHNTTAGRAVNERIALVRFRRVDKPSSPCQTVRFISAHGIK